MPEQWNELRFALLEWKRNFRFVGVRWAETDLRCSGAKSNKPWEMENNSARRSRSPAMFWDGTGTFFTFPFTRHLISIWSGAYLFSKWYNFTPCHDTFASMPNISARSYLSCVKWIVRHSPRLIYFPCDTRQMIYKVSRTLRMTETIFSYQWKWKAVRPSFSP